LCAVEECYEPALPGRAVCAAHDLGRMVTVDCDPSDGAKLAAFGYFLWHSHTQAGTIIQTWAKIIVERPDAGAK
jgi:hypothetical protein